LTSLDPRIPNFQITKMLQFEAKKVSTSIQIMSTLFRIYFKKLFMTISVLIILTFVLKVLLIVNYLKILWRLFKMKKIVFQILFFTFAMSIIGCAGSCNNNNKLSGTLYVAGNEPFTYLALDTKDRTVYKIECADSLKKELWQLQGKTVELNFTKLKEFDKMNTAIVNGYSIKDSEDKD